MNIDHHDEVQQMLIRISAVHVDLQSQMTAIDRIHAVVGRSPTTPGQILVLEADPSLGKSRAIDVAEGKVASTQSRPLGIPVSRIVCLPGTDGAQLAQLAVTQLEIPAFAMGNPAKFGDYLRKNLRSRGTGIFVLENAHCMVRENVLVRTGIVEILGAVVASGVVPLLLSGRTGAQLVAQRLIETVGQAQEVISLSPLLYTHGAELSDTAAFLGLLAAQINPMLEETGLALRLHGDDMAKRFWGASWGVPGNIVAILREALRSLMVARRGSGCRSRYELGPKDFAEAWRSGFALTSPLKFNPFSRHDPPALGEMADAIRIAKEKIASDEIKLPRAPTATGASLYA